MPRGAARSGQRPARPTASPTHTRPIDFQSGSRRLGLRLIMAYLLWHIMAGSLRSYLLQRIMASSLKHRKPTAYRERSYVYLRVG